MDLLILGDVEMSNERLTLPHREASSRRFVLSRCSSSIPSSTLPDGTRLADALAALGDGERVRSATAPVA